MKKYILLFVVTLGLTSCFEHKDDPQPQVVNNTPETSIDNLKMGAKKPPMPFSDTRLLNVLQHTFWFLPTVAACFAMNTSPQTRP